MIKVMAEKIDIYPLLKQYVLKAGTKSVSYASFVDFAGRWAKHYLEKNPLLAELAEQSEFVIAPLLAGMQRERKCALSMIDNKIANITLPDYFLTLINNEIKRIDENPDTPFPEESALGFDLPNEWIRAISLEADLSSVLAEKKPETTQFYRITFAESVSPIIVLSDHVPEKLFECAVLKIRHWMRKESNREFVHRKMQTAFMNKELMLKDAFNLLMTRPYDAIQEVIRSTSDFTFPFWAYLVSNVRQDLQKVSEKTPLVVTLLQSVSLVEFFNNYYRARAQKRLDLETAYRNLEQNLSKAPFLFTMDDIVRFSDTKGSPLLGKYTKEELETYLTEQRKTPPDRELPPLVVFSSALGPQYFILQERIIPLCVKLISDARSDIKSQITQSWFKQLGTFKSYGAMEDDALFLQELTLRLEKASPVLYTLLTENLFLLAFFELRRVGGAKPEIERCFKNDELVFLDELLQLSRKSLLTDVKILLPIWYSIPIVKSIIAFFAKMEAKKKVNQSKAVVESEEKSVSPAKEQDKRVDLVQAAARVEKQLLPEGYELDDYLVELETRWNKLLNPQAKKNLTQDVNSLIRDYVRSIIKTLRGSSLTKERIDTLARSLCGTPSLLKISNANAFREYVTLYMIKLVKNIR